MGISSTPPVAVMAVSLPTSVSSMGRFLTDRLGLRRSMCTPTPKQTTQTAFNFHKASFPKDKYNNSHEQ
ncbi:Hypothetical predicted protein [Drosophila guanche]|uniref:Uncharacterized protein n=1 Tax=Drosophila guanche TaxID=7266 RepID=A0A3B0JSX0_DROGU|nr:Hypothetical predicted protein [Drosophila guanche]